MIVDIAADGIGILCDSPTSTAFSQADNSKGFPLVTKDQTYN